MSRFLSGSQHSLIERIFSAYTIPDNPRVRQVMLDVDRKDFAPHSPYNDQPIEIGYGATISAPHMHAYALSLAEEKIKENSRILDVGSGSGYLTACFAKMIGSAGRVFGVEHIRELVDLAKSNVRKSNAGLLESGRLIFVVGDGRNGYPEQAPYDVIHVGAASADIPKALIDQLAVGGRMLIPVGPSGHQQFMQIDKVSDAKFVKKIIVPVNYVPLTSQEAQLRNGF